MYDNLSMGELNERIRQAQRAQANIDARAREVEVAASLPDLLQARAVLLEAEAQQKIADLHAAAETVARAQVAVNQWRGELFALLEVGPVAKQMPLEAVRMGHTIDGPDRERRAHYLDRLRGQCEQLAGIMGPVLALGQRHQIDLGFSLGQVPEQWRRFVGDVLADWL